MREVERGREAGDGYRDSADDLPAKETDLPAALATERPEEQPDHQTASPAGDPGAEAEAAPFPLFPVLPRLPIFSEALTWPAAAHPSWIHQMFVPSFTAH